MPAILALIPLFQSALSVIGAFKGSAVEAKATGYFQDALGIVTAVTPLITQFGNGEEVTPEQVRAALAGKDAALASFDELIKQKGG